MSVDIDTKKP